MSSCLWAFVFGKFMGDFFSVGHRLVRHNGVAQNERSADALTGQMCAGLSHAFASYNATRGLLSRCR